MKKAKCVKKKIIIMNWKYTYERWLEDRRENYLGKSILQFAIEKENLDIDLKILILMICLFKFILLQTYVTCN